MEMIAKTDPGKVRDHNEDAYLCEPEMSLAVIADGMGGHAAGEVAAEITINTCRELLRENGNLVAAMMTSHERITQHAQQHPESKGMGCAVVAANFNATQVNVCWVGDARAYLFNPDTGLAPISRDHSYVQWLLANGQISEQQARIHPDRNLVMQCLGIKPPQPESNLVAWQFNDIVLLCSDGLTDEVDDQAIAAILQQNSNLEVALDQLVHEALENGGKDNITVALIRNTVQPLKELTQAVAKSDVKEKPWLAIAIGVGTALVVALFWYLLH